jgi:hypothetical protein
MLWRTEKHGEIPCEFRGFDDDERVIIRVPDPFDKGVVEIHVPRSEIAGLAEEQTRVAVEWTLRHDGDRDE